MEKDLGTMNLSDLMVITGAGGFIAGNLVLYFKQKGFANIRASRKSSAGNLTRHWIKGLRQLTDGSKTNTSAARRASTWASADGHEGSLLVQ